MPYTQKAKDVMLDALHRGTAPTLQTTHVGLFTKSAQRTPTGVTSTDTFTDTAHGYSNGDILVFDSLTGGSNLVAGRVYYVIGATANTYQLSHYSAGSAVDLGTDVTAATVRKWTEISGGSPAYARKAIAYAAPADGAIDDSTNGALFDVPAAAQVNGVSEHSASTAGTLMSLDEVTQETFAAQGTYNLTDAKRNLNQSDAL